MGYSKIGGRYAHRVIYERHFGPIPPGWVVHHKDEDKSNNDPANLEAMPRSEHHRLHALGRENSEAQKSAAAKTLESLRKPKPATCVQCGGGFVSLSANKPSRFCSSPCREKWRANAFKPEQRVCLVCSSPYLAVKRFQRYCSKRCNAKSTVRTYREGGNSHKRRTLAEHDNLQPDS